jgi:hypothetical protein
MMFDYHVVATKDISQVKLASSIDHPLPGPTNTFFRPHEFIKFLVPHGKDTPENLMGLYGYKMKDTLDILRSQQGNQAKERPRSSRPWMQVIGRTWFQAHIAVACGVGAPDGVTHALAMGARAPRYCNSAGAAANAESTSRRGIGEERSCEGQCIGVFYMSRHDRSTYKL